MRPHQRVATLLVSFVVVLAGSAPGQPVVLRYDPPAGFFGGGGTKDTWISDNADGLIHIYQFEPFSGSFQEHRDPSRSSTSARAARTRGRATGRAR